MRGTLKPLKIKKLFGKISRDVISKMGVMPTAEERKNKENLRGGWLVLTSLILRSAVPERNWFHFGLTLCSFICKFHVKVRVENAM